LYEFARTLLSPRIDAAVPLVGRVDPLSARVPPGFSQRAFVGATEGSEPADTQIQLLGMAIFKGKRMVGTLTTDDGSGLRWIYGGNKGILTIPHPVQEGHYIVATSINSSAKRRVRFENGRLVLGIEVQAVMDAWGEGIFEPLAIAKYAPAIERDLAGMIEKNVRKTMERLQELKADIFGFGEELYRSSPKEWDKVAEVWGGRRPRRGGPRRAGAAAPRSPAPEPPRRAGTDAGAACRDRGLVDDGQNLGGLRLQRRPVAARFHVEPQQRLGV